MTCPRCDSKRTFYHATDEKGFAVYICVACECTFKVKAGRL